MRGRCNKRGDGIAAGGFSAGLTPGGRSAFRFGGFLVGRFFSRFFSALPVGSGFIAAERSDGVLEGADLHELQPEVVADAKSSLSNVCVHLDRNAEAEEWLEQILDEFPDDVGADNDLGYLWAERGVHPQRALRMTRRAALAEPDNIAYLDSYGWALFRLGQYEEAVKQLRRAVDNEAPDGVILDHLGDALLRTEGEQAAIP